MSPPPEDAPTAPLAPAPDLAPAMLPPGALLAGRYRIVRFLAQGGMGSVYEVDDAELATRVALKTIRPELAGAATLERFRREILTARRVTHPNVARVFDLGRHDEEGRSVVFLTMELLAGETLADRLRRRGRMAAGEALPIAGQVLDALAAAHRAGVVHRDFKPANVMLVPSPPSPGGVRAVVMDFGLARSWSGTEASTVTGLALGTASYMAPEQLQGGELTPAADLYALGITLYEMVTGARPFAGDTPLATALQRLHRAPPPPSAIVPELDRAWEHAILRCLERDPAARFASAEDVARALRGEPVPAPPGRARRLQALATAGLLVVAGALGLWSWSRQRVAPPPPSAAAPSVPHLPSPPAVARRAVAVLGFRDLSGRPESAWLSTALSEMLATELAAGEALRTIPGENVARARADLGLPETDALEPASLARVRALTGADHVVLGSYVLIGNASRRQLRVDLRLQDTASGGTRAVVAETGREADLFELVGRAGAQLRDRLGVAPASAADTRAAEASRPSSPKAVRLYAEGLAKLRVFDARAARERLERAVAEDPSWPLAHAALSATWTALGYDARARDEGKRAYELAGSLSREERLAVEGRYRATTREWGEAIRIYGALFGFFPDNVDYGLQLAAAQSQSGHGKDALTTIAVLRQLPPPARDDPRIDVAEAAAYQTLSDFKRMIAASERAAKRAAAVGARLVAARAGTVEAWGRINQGENQRALELFERAQRMFAEAGAQGEEAKVVGNSGIALYMSGDHAGALARMKTSLALYRASGDRRGEAVTLHNLPIAFIDEGQLAEARASTEQALAIYREIGDLKSEGMIRSNLGLIRLLQGDLASARRLYEEAAARMRELGVRNEVARALINLATLERRNGDLRAAEHAVQDARATWEETKADQRLLAYIDFELGGLRLAQGRLDDARKAYDAALEVCEKAGNKSYAAYAHTGRGELEAARGDLAAARKDHEQALALRRSLGERSYAAESQAALAALALEEGRPEEAEAAAREAARELAREGRLGSNASEWGTEPAARLLRARALLALGRSAEAAAELARVRKLLEASPSRFVELEAAIAGARERAAAGRVEEALQGLEAAEAEARQAGFAGPALEASLARGELQLAAGRGDSGRARLRSLVEEARQAGFETIARQAAALARRP